MRGQILKAVLTDAEHLQCPNDILPFLVLSACDQFKKEPSKNQTFAKFVEERLVQILRDNPSLAAKPSLRAYLKSLMSQEKYKVALANGLERNPEVCCTAQFSSLSLSWLFSSAPVCTFFRCFPHSVVSCSEMLRN
jgi:hypothetical protein